MTTTCPMCAEEILPDAKKCKHCGEILDPHLRSRSVGNQFRQLAIFLLIVIVALVIWAYAKSVEGGISG